MKKKNYIYVTLLGTDDYVIGALCLAASLEKVHSRYPLLVLCSKNVSAKVIGFMQSKGLKCKMMDERLTMGAINSGEFERWNNTFDKLQVFNLTEYDKLVFLDSDMFVVKNMDHLFEKPHMSAVYADIWDKTTIAGLNSGLMVVEPNKNDYEGLLDLFRSEKFANATMFGDQDVIRAYYFDWLSKAECHLPIGYNLYYPFVNDFINRYGGVKYLTFILFMTRNRGSIRLRHCCGD